MIEKPSLPRRIGTAIVGFLLLALLAVASATPARAICSGDTCGGGGGPTDYTSTLVVTPSGGTVTITPVADAPTTCDGTTPTCSVTDVISTVGDTRPTTGWLTYTLTWTPAQPYYAFDGWTGACTGTGSCVLTNDQPTKAVGVRWHDARVQTNASLNVPDRINPATALSADVTGDFGPYDYTWSYCTMPCGFLDPGHTFGSGPVARLAAVSPALPTADYQIQLALRDARNVMTTWRATTTLVTTPPLLTVSDLAGLTKSASLTFGTEDGRVPADDGHRMCRAYLTGTAPTSWQACTTPTTFAPTLTDGDWTLGVQVVDDTGLTSTLSRTTTIDNTAPVVVFGDAPSDGATVDADSVQLTFTAVDNHPGTTTCSVDGAAATACTSPLILTGLGNGVHAVTVAAADSVGNDGTATRQFTIALPTTLTAPAVRTTYGRSTTLSATMTPADATGTVAFVTAGRTLCTAPVSAGAAHCSAPASLAAGTHAVTVTYAGPYAPSTASLELAVAKATARVAPTVAHSSLQRNAMQTVTARGLPSGRVSVRQSGRTLCQAAVVHGVARCAFRVAMTVGRHVLSVRYSGNANHLAATGRVPFTVTR